MSLKQTQMIYELLDEKNKLRRAEKKEQQALNWKPNKEQQLESLSTICRGRIL